MPKEKTIKVKAIENLSTFMAVDGKLYKLKKGDIVSLPKTNADILLMHGVAVLSKGKVTTKSYTPPRLKPKKEKEYKLTQREKWLLEGKYKILGLPKKVKTKKTKTIPRDYEVKEVLGVFDIYFNNEHIGTRPTREGAMKYISAHKDYRIGAKKPKIPTGLTLQEELDRQGGQMHFRTDNKKPKALSAKKTKKRIKKGSNNLMAFGVKLSNVKTLEDMMG